MGGTCSIQLKHEIAYKIFVGNPQRLDDENVDLTTINVCWT
jgi:hypothetical protein